MHSSLVSRSIAKQTAAAATRAPRSMAASNLHRFYSSTMHDNDPEILEREKYRNLNKKQFETSPIDNAPGWNQLLASASEANVKADRSDLNPSELAAKTVENVMKIHHQEEEDLKKALSSRLEDHHEERIDAREATYERDEISGPLREKGIKETEMIKETTRRRT